MKITSAGKTDKGKTRSNNEDSFLVDDDMGLYAAADGIGGHAGGEVASRMAVEMLQQGIRDGIAGKGITPPYGSGTGADPLVSALAYAYTTANARIIEAGSRESRLAGMGTTMTSLVLKGKTARLAHVGDSRAYLLRGGRLEQLSEDHTVVAEQVRAGLITAEQARRSSYRHVITRALGIDREVTADQKTIGIMPNDVFLLCTDGLTEMVGDQQIEQILASAAPREAADKLIAAANNAGGVDNITVVVAKIEAVG